MARSVPKVEVGKLIYETVNYADMSLYSTEFKSSFAFDPLIATAWLSNNNQAIEAMIIRNLRDLPKDLERMSILQSPHAAVLLYDGQPVDSVDLIDLEEACFRYCER